MSTLFLEVAKNNEPASIVDNEKPCCSKSITKKNYLAEFAHADIQTANNDHINDLNDCSPNPETYQLNNYGLAFSDTILTIIPKLPEFERQDQDEGPINQCSQIWNEKLDDQSRELVSRTTRKPPKVSVILDAPDARIKSSLSSRSNSTASLLESKAHILNSRHGGNPFYDANHNEIKWSSKSEKKLVEHASYLFHEDRRDHLAETVRLLPRGREYVVFNVFTDFARLFGYRRHRRKHVAFPSEVLKQYEEKGDVAGKDRFVPVAKQPYKGVAASKKRKLSAVYSSWTVKEADFIPRVERIDDYSKLEYFCERKCIACDCCADSRKPDLTNVMEGFLSDLNVASLFIHGHASRTFESAMSNLEFVKVHHFSLTSITPASILQKNYSKQKLGILSTSVWIFGYCVRSILQQAIDCAADNSVNLPSELGVRKLLENFAAMCLTIMENVKTVLQYSHNFYNFCMECIRILRVIQIHVGFRGELKIKQPLKRGDGLQIDRSLKKKDIMKQKAVKVMIAKSKPGKDESEEDELEWKSFEELNGNDKVSTLRHLLSVTSEGINLVQTQLRFLLDDIVDSVRDITEADLLFILADMYDRVRYLENIGRKHTKTEMEQICHLMTDFCKDFQAFVDLGQQIMKRFVEIRDMIHVTYEFLVKGVRLESLSEMLPAKAFQKKRAWCGCCDGRMKSRKRIVESHQPKYSSLDFFRVCYTEAVNKKAQIYADKFYFTLAWSDQKINSIFPQSKLYNWGELDGETPRMSLDEYAEPEADDEPQVEIKPILVGSPGSSPRGSILSNDGGSGENLAMDPRRKGSGS